MAWGSGLAEGVDATVAIARTCAGRLMGDAVELIVDMETLRSTRADILGRNEADMPSLTVGSARLSEILGTNMDPEDPSRSLCAQAQIAASSVSQPNKMHGLRLHTLVTMKVRLDSSHRQIAVEGCLHGELDAIYRDILENERETGEQVDLVLLCGDIQVRTVVLMA